MTQMLASVAGATEAALALTGGADLIDLKFPEASVDRDHDASVLQETMNVVRGRRPVSAATGVADMSPTRVRKAAEAVAATGVDTIRQVFLSGGEPAACISALAPLAAHRNLQAVLFADRTPDFSLIPLLAQAGFAGVMLDTVNKHAGRLLDHLDLPALHRFVRHCSEHRLVSGLAGSLEAPDVPRLLPLHPGFLGFRGALRGGAGQFNAGAMREIRDLIPRESAPANARGEADGLRGRSGPRQGDRVFLHDFVLPVRIGAYGHEQGEPQRVRFDVDVLVARRTRPVRSMSDVFSYDVISDGIRLLAESGHFLFTETIAERIATMLLAHSRVLRVRVKVIKLDVGPAMVGVEIERGADDATWPGG